ncbi:hypothetical protein [Chitinilyticum piscinae]|uniref:Uncharacterized protein n=1 Tax=Chitinilyticum piscinae TaxID=2866724 RepID=A0A8J7FIM2_9NEIS|nr:hypothetical protein [Chitinilyticum piscinae]MBE9609985.1 hypothetical protein [Chitinilyticum piscinae]
MRRTRFAMPFRHAQCKLAALLTVLALLGHAQAAESPAYRISYSSLAERSCTQAVTKLGKYGSEDAFRCPGHRDFGVAIAVNDAYSWPLLYRSSSRQLWDLQQLALAALPEGSSFPAVPANARLEWLDFADGRLGIIFRIEGFQAERGNTVSRLLALEYARGELSYCGSAVSNEMARQRLQQGSNCSRQIASELLSTQ